MRHRLLLLLALAAPGCAVKGAANYAPPRERATECVSYCDALSMRLAAVVIISNSAGCVCEPTDAARAADRGAAAIAGGAAIQAAAERRRAAAGMAQTSLR